MDSEITTVNPLSFQFYLKLPQYIYDVSDNTATPVLKAISSPAPSSVDKLLNNLFQDASIPPSSPTKGKNSSISYAPNPSSTGVFSFFARILFSASTSNPKSDIKSY